MVAGALIGTGVGWAAGVSQATATTTAVTTGVTITTTISADGDPTNELTTAIKVGQTAIEQVTNLNKISSQLTSKATILDISISGNMSNLSNPQVQQGLSRLNNVCSSPTSRIIIETFKNKPVFEYIENGIGVMRNPSTGELISVFSRTGRTFELLQPFVDNGTAHWLR